MSSIGKITPLFTCLVIAVAVLNSPALSAQALGSLLPSSQSSPAPSPPSDPLNRTTPRSSIYSFLQACHDQNFIRASQYLDLRRIRPEQRTTQGPEFAKQLGLLLDRDPHFEVQKLNNAPEGNLTEGLAPDRETLDTFNLNGQPVSLQMQRVNQNGLNVWLVSADSVAHIPELERLVAGIRVRKEIARSTRIDRVARYTFVGVARFSFVGFASFSTFPSFVQSCHCACEATHEAVFGMVPRAQT